MTDLEAKRVSIVVAHAPWPPHQGGGKTPQWTEHNLSKVVSALSATKIRGLGFDVNQVEMPDREGCRVFRCVGCTGGSCDQYNRGLAWTVNEGRRLAGEGGLTLSFHVDMAAPGNRGPLALVSHGAIARAWADAYMEHWTNTTGIKGRGVWVMPDHKIDFPSNPYFCRQYPQNGGAVLLEIGCASSALDCALFDAGKGVELVANAAVEATRTLLN